MTASNDTQGNGAGPARPVGVEPAPLDAREVLAIFWRRRWLIGPVMLAVLGAFAAWSLLKVPEYKAVARVQVLQDEPTVPGLGVEAMVSGLPTDPVRSEIQVLRSRSLLYAVADSLALQLTVGASPWRRDLLFPGLRIVGQVAPGAYELALEGAEVAVYDQSGARQAAGAPGSPVEVAGVAFTLPEWPPQVPPRVGFELRTGAEAGEELYEEFRADVVERTNLVDLSYRAHDPALATGVLNAIMELGRGQSVERLRERASARRRFIERQLAEFEGQLRQAQADVQAYQEQIGAVSIESEQSGQIANILAFEREVEELRLERQLYRPILDGLDRARDEAGGAGEGADTTAAGDTAAGQLAAEQVAGEEAAAEQAVADRAASFEALAATPALVKNPAIADLYRRMVALEVKRDSLLSGPVGAGAANPAVRAVDDQIRTAAGKLTDALREYLAGIDRQIEEQRRTIARLQRASEGRLPHAAELARREQKVESLRKVYEVLQTQMEQTRIEEASESGRLAIIDPATVPRQPVNATGIADIILALMLAGMLGFGGALVVDYFDDRLRSPREVRRNLGFTVLGAVPRFDAPDGRGMSDEQARVHLEQLSAPAEAYRIIRTNLSFVHAVKPRRTLLVTSPEPGTGKTTTAINLAAVLSQQGERTLLLDADMRRSSVHELLGVRGDVGLTSVLTGRARLDEAIVPAGIDGLEVLPAGPKPPNPAELLGSERMTKLLTVLAGRYDRIVVDSPPVLAVADPSALARQLDGVLMVARAGKTNRQALVEAVQALSDVGGDVLGVVVNALKHEPGMGGGGYYYYRDGYYGDGRRNARNRLRQFVSGVGGVLFILAIGAAVVGFGLWSVLDLRKASGADDFIEAASLEGSAAQIETGAAGETGAPAETTTNPANPEPGAVLPLNDPVEEEPADVEVPSADVTSRAVPLPYSVAVASFLSQEDALRATQRLKGDGTAPIYVVPAAVDSAVYYRVYAGALPDRAAAERLLARLVRDGVKPDTSAWDVRAAGYAFDLGTFPGEHEARAAIEALAARGVAAYALPVGAGAGYRLYAGGYASRDQAAALRERIEAAGLDTVLVRRVGVAAAQDATDHR